MAKEDKKIDFESSLKELENIVAKLEDENINLEDSVKSFEKGVNLVKECQKQLQTAELELDTKLKQQELELKKREAKVDFLIKQEELRIKQQKLEQGEMEIALEAVQERPVKIGND